MEEGIDLENGFSGIGSGEGMARWTCGKAIAQSCDVYFYKIGNRMGIETIASYSKDFGLGQKNRY